MLKNPNKKMIVLVAAVILPLIFLGLVYIPANDALSKLKKKSYASQKDPIGKKDIENIMSEKKNLLGGYNKIVNFYEDIEKHDSEKSPSLEGWHEKLLKQMGQQDAYPTLTVFKTAYGVINDELDERLKNYLESKVIPEGWFRDSADDIDKIEKGKQNEIIKLLQKRFWIKERLVNTLKSLTEDGKLTAIRFSGLVFFKELGGKQYKDIRNFPGYKAFKEETSISIEFSSVDDKGQVQKSNIKVADTITFGIALELNYSDIFKFIQAFLHPANKPQMLVEITGVNVFVGKGQSSDEIKRDSITVQEGTPEEEIKRRLEDKRKILQDNNRMIAYIAFRVIDPDVQGLQSVENLFNTEDSKGK